MRGTIWADQYQVECWRTVDMNFSILQVSRCRIDTLSSLWGNGFFSLRKASRTGYGSKLVASNAYGVGGRCSRWIRRPISIEIGTQNNGSKASTLKNELSEEAVTNLNGNKSESSEIRGHRYCDIQKLSENRGLESLVTVMVFDIETTGFSRDNDRIIEIALQDLGGGKNSTFQTLVNPGRFIPNTRVHGINTHMVNRHDVPRMEELIPIMLQYVHSRQKPGGYVLWVAHNARTFDVPFLRSEFSRCSTEVPQNWLFLDTLPLARELIKSGEAKISSGTSLQALREYYRIQLTDTAHRAMADVNVLSSILQRLTFDLKLTVSGLVERSFTISDLSSPKKKSLH